MNPIPQNNDSGTHLGKVLQKSQRKECQKPGSHQHGLQNYPKNCPRLALSGSFYKLVPTSSPGCLQTFKNTIFHQKVIQFTPNVPQVAPSFYVLHLGIPPEYTMDFNRKIKNWRAFPPARWDVLVVQITDLPRTHTRTAVCRRLPRPGTEPATILIGRRLATTVDSSPFVCVTRQGERERFAPGRVQNGGRRCSP